MPGLRDPSSNGSADKRKRTSSNAATMASPLGPGALQNKNPQQYAESSDEDDGPSSNKRSKRPVLSEEQKNKNHVNSEKKRREKIREQYDILASIIPGMEGQGRAESKILAAAYEHALHLVEKRKDLLAQARVTGIDIPPELLDSRFDGPENDVNHPEAEPNSGHQDDDRNDSTPADGEQG